MYLHEMQPHCKKLCMFQFIAKFLEEVTAPSRLYVCNSRKLERGMHCMCVRTGHTHDVQLVCAESKLSSRWTTVNENGNGNEMEMARVVNVNSYRIALWQEKPHNL